MLSRVAVLGADGQVGRALVTLLGERVIPIRRADLDLTQQPEKLPDLLDAIMPDAVINASAYTAVDKAEDELDQAFLLNALVPGILAHYCAEKNIPLVHFSTDYVFDGSGSRPWREDDAPLPLNIYGHTKLGGEQAVQSGSGRFLIFRTSWVYDAKGKNFLTAMLRLGAEREEIRVVADQHGAPTYAPHLAQASLACLEKALAMPGFPSGIYHLCQGGETTWYGFAEEIFATARAKGLPVTVRKVEAIPAAAYPTPAVRPLNSRLDCAKAEKTFGVRLPVWEDGLKQAMEALDAGD